MLTLPVLAWVPVGTSLILGMMYLHLGEARPALKFLGTVVFVAALYLQFFSSHTLAGLLLQVGLALCLAMWQRVSGVNFGDANS
jgi:hypothetical protein